MRFLSANFKVQATALGAALALGQRWQPNGAPAPVINQAKVG